MRGWGPFSGGQLTVVIVAVAAMFAVPTAALAATGAFTSASNTVPAVKASNTGTAGTGVSGTGKKYGVYSNGHLGVAANKLLRCASCVTSGNLATGSVASSKLAAGSVTPAALSATAKAVQPLLVGQSESGVIAASDSYVPAQPGSLLAGVTFVRPVLTAVTIEVGPSIHCPAPGSAASGFMCLYDAGSSDAVLDAANSDFKGIGAIVVWNEGGVGEAVGTATYTVKA